MLAPRARAGLWRDHLVVQVDVRAAEVSAVLVSLLGGNDLRDPRIHSVLCASRVCASEKAQWGTGRRSKQRTIIICKLIALGREKGVVGECILFSAWRLAAWSLREEAFLPLHRPSAPQRSHTASEVDRGREGGKGVEGSGREVGCGRGRQGRGGEARGGEGGTRGSHGGGRERCQLAEDNEKESLLID